MTEQAQTLPAAIQALTAAELFDADADAVARVIGQVETAARSIVPDASTDKGRRAIASLAAKVARSKTFLDALGKDHVAELKRRAGEVDAKRRVIRERLDALKAEVRQPLTDYEQREADRQAAIEALIGALRQMPPADPFTDSETLQARIADLESAEIGEAYAERRAEAEQVRAATLYELGRRLTAVREREAAEAAAEAERIEAARIEREQREARIAAEAADRARREAEAAAAQRERDAAAAATAEQRRIQAEREAAERRAKQAEWERERAEQAAREAEQRAARQAEQAARDAEQRIEREAAAQRAADAERARDREHQAQVNREVLADLCDLGLDEPTAKRLIGAIANGHVAHVSITY
jgi:hypothetical protein